MIAAKSLQEIIYNHLFPGGAIPFGCKDNILAIDSRIQEIEQLAAGADLPGANRRLNRANSLRLTEQIIQLRESCDPPMNYKEIMCRLGNVITSEAARNRYDDAKRAMKAGTYRTPPEVQQKMEVVQACSAPAAEQAPAIESAATAEDGKGKEIEQVVLPAAQPALLEATPEQSENPTIRESQIVEKVEEVKPDDATLRNVAKVDSEATKQPQNSHIVADLSKKGKYDRYEVPISPEVDEEILRLYSTGLGVNQISDELAKRGILIPWRRVRGRISNAAREKQADTSDVAETSPSPSLPGVEGAPEEVARANPRGTPEEKQSAPMSAKPDPKLDFYEVADSKIINMKKRGMLNHEIASVLERNPGGSWTVQKVDARYTELKRQGLI